MKAARGSVRRLLIALSEVQHLVGIARGQMMNDRNPDAYEKARDALDRAFSLCVSARSEYAPTKETDNERTVGNAR